MLTTKAAVRERLTDATMRETVKGEDGRVLVILNLTYPAVEEKSEARGRSCSKRASPNRVFFRFLRKKEDTDAPLAQVASFYRSVAEAFASFARGELAKRAAANDAELPPCGAVLRWRLQEETDDSFTVELDGSVFDGVESHPIPKDVRVWRKCDGLLERGT